MVERGTENTEVDEFDSLLRQSTKLKITFTIPIELDKDVINNKENKN